MSAYQERCKSLATENEELRRQHKKLVRQHEELRDSKNEEIKALEYRLETCLTRNSNAPACFQLHPRFHEDSACTKCLEQVS